MKYVRKEDGFRNQELYVVPPDISSDKSLPHLIRNLMVTDAGYFPSAAGHQKIRKTGINEGILLLCTDGEGFVRIGGDPTVFLKKNQAFYIKPSTEHIYGASDSSPWSLYWMHMKGELLDSYAAPLDGCSGAVPLDSRTMEQTARMFTYLLEAMKEGYTTDAMMKSGQLAGAVFTSVLYGNRDFHRDISASNLKRVDRVVSRMRDSLEEGRHLSLEDMAAYLDLSVPHFSEVFRRARGYSPMDYYGRMKIQKACRLLEMTNLEIQDIALRTSYHDRYYFSRVFKKIMGLPPTAYREKAGRISETEQMHNREVNV